MGAAPGPRQEPYPSSMGHRILIRTTDGRANAAWTRFRLGVQLCGAAATHDRGVGVCTGSCLWGSPPRRPHDADEKEGRRRPCMLVPPRAVPVGVAAFRRVGQPGGGLAQALAESSRYVCMH
eukprot:364139-Chlamydomonas_euryale.AAC.10